VRLILPSPANPSYTVAELVFQLQTSRANLIFTHSEFVKTAVTAAQEIGIPQDRIVILPATGGKQTTGDAIIGISIEELISSAKSTSFKEYQLKPGQAKTKLAFLSFSSGTTGRF